MRERIQTIIRAFQATREVDDRLVLWVAGGAALGFLVTLALGFVFDQVLLFALLGVLVAILVALSVFGRRAQAAQFTAIEGHAGAAAAVLNQMRGQWFVTPVVAVTRKQEMVHRVIGRPGIILVGETGEGGSAAKLKQLLAQEKRKAERVAGDVPVHTVLVGKGDKAVELSKLQWHITKLGNEVSKKDVPRLHRKLAPLDKGNVPIPKGFIPQNVSKKQR